jgi:ribosomal protein S27AE
MEYAPPPDSRSGLTSKVSINASHRPCRAVLPTSRQLAKHQCLTILFFQADTRVMFGILRANSPPAMQTPTDTTLTIYCPHCQVGIEFKPMTAHKDGRFVCGDCAHTERPGFLDYWCTCRPCLRFRRWIASTAQYPR